MFFQRMFCCFSIGSSSRAAQVPENLFNDSSRAAQVQEGLLIGSSGAAEIPDDLLIEILVRVPAELVTKFRGLSKFHRDLIDSLDFRRKHTNLSIKRTACGHAILGGRTSWRPSKIDDYHVMNLDSAKFDAKAEKLINSLKNKGYYPVDSCLGILCLLHLPKSGVDGGHILLCNPLTGDRRSIPVNYDYNNYWYYKYFLGHDSVTDDFKILKANYKPYSDYPETRDCEIYSCKIGCWRKIIGGKWEIGPKLGLFCGGTFVPGTDSVHMEFNCSKDDHIHAFDFSSDKFNKIPLPAEYSSIVLSSLDGCLCFCAQCGDNMCVWVMKEYGVKESWTRSFCMSNPYFGRLFLKPLKFVNHGRQLLLLSIHLYKYECGLHMFDFEKNKAIKKLATSSSIFEAKGKFIDPLCTIIYPSIMPV